MWCRTILTAVAITYVICMLVLSGLQKEDLDANTLEKLRRHNVSIDDKNNDSLPQECLLNAGTGNATQEHQTEDNKTRPLILYATNKSDNNKIDVGNVGDYLNLEMHLPESYDVQNVLRNAAEEFIRQTFNNNFKTSHELNYLQDLENKKKILGNKGSQNEFGKNEPALQNDVNFWNKLTHDSKKLVTLYVTTPLPNIVEENNVLAKIETSYNNGYEHSREMEYISRILAEYLANQTVPTTTQGLTTKIEMNLRSKKNEKNETPINPKLNDKKEMSDIITRDEVYPHQLNSSHTEDTKSIPYIEPYVKYQQILKNVLKTSDNHELRFGPKTAERDLNENVKPIQFLDNLLQIDSAFQNIGQLIPYIENNIKGNKFLVSENNQQHDENSDTINRYKTDNYKTKDINNMNYTFLQIQNVETNNNLLRGFPKPIKTWQTMRNYRIYNKKLNEDKKEMNQEQSLDTNDDKIKGIKNMRDSEEVKSFGTNNESQNVASNLKNSKSIRNAKIKNPYEGTGIYLNTSKQIPNYDNDNVKYKGKSVDLKKMKHIQNSKMYNDQDKEETIIKNTQHFKELPEVINNRDQARNSILDNDHIKVLPVGVKQSRESNQFKGANTQNLEPVQNFEIGNQFVPTTNNRRKIIRKSNQFEGITEYDIGKLGRTQNVDTEKDQSKIRTLDIEVSKENQYIDNDNDPFKEMLPSIKNLKQIRISRLHDNRLKIEELKKSERLQHFKKNNININEDMPSKRNINARMNYDQFNATDVGYGELKLKPKALKSYDRSRNYHNKFKHLQLNNPKLNQSIEVNNGQLQDVLDQNQDSKQFKNMPENIKNYKQYQNYAINNDQRQIESDGKQDYKNQLKNQPETINYPKESQSIEIDNEQQQAGHDQNQETGNQINNIPISVTNPAQEINEQHQARFERNQDFRIQSNKMPVKKVNNPETNIEINDEVHPARYNRNNVLRNHFENMQVNKVVFNRKRDNSKKRENMSVNLNTSKQNQNNENNNEQGQVSFNDRLNDPERIQNIGNKNQQHQPEFNRKQDYRQKFKHTPANIKNLEGSKIYPVPRAGVDVKDLNNKYSEKNLNVHQMPEKFIEDIAQKVKKMVLKDITNEGIKSTLPSSPLPTATTRASTVTTTEKPTTINKEMKEANVVQKLLEMFDELKALKDPYKVKKHPINDEPLPVNQHVNSNPFEAKQPVNIKPHKVKHSVNINTVEVRPYGPNMVPVHISSGTNLPLNYAVPFVPRLNYQQRNEFRSAAITIQTNAEEIAPLAIQLLKPLKVLNQQIIVTTKSPSEILKEVQERESKKRLEDKFSSAMTNHNGKLHMHSDSSKKPRLPDSLKKHEHDEIFRFRENLNKDRQNAMQRHEYGVNVRHIDNKPKMSSYPDRYSHLGHHANFGHPRGFSHYSERHSGGSKRPVESYQDGISYHAGLHGYAEQHQRSHPRYEPTKFHEQLEKNESWPRNSWRGYKSGSTQNWCEEGIPARQQMPLTKVKQRKKYDDTHFKNFLKSQQQVTYMLEKILTDNTKNSGPLSVEVP